LILGSEVVLRKVEHLLWDLSRIGPLPSELAGKVRPTESRDVFLRRVAFHHWIHCSHPDRNPELWNSRYRPDRNPFNFLNDQVVNFEVSDCLFQGASQLFHNVHNGRIVRNEFSNGMGTCWTALAQGAVVVVAEKNDLRCSSSWGYGRIGIDRVFSSENICHNFVQGEREAMTLDISATPATPPGPVPEGSSNPNGIHNRNIAWFGFPEKVGPNQIVLRGIRSQAGQFVGKTVMVLDGPGVGQFRRIVQNTADRFFLDRPWDVLPTPASTLGLWDLSRQMIVSRCEGYDTSSFAQLWGSFYEYIVDDCRVERSQGLWGQSGWFVQFRNNQIRYGHAYHPKIGMRGPNPEGNSPFGYLGLMDGDLRITKFGSAQYGSPEGKPLFVREVLGRQIPGIRGFVMKGNTLAYNQRMVLVPSPSAPEGPEPLLIDAMVENNQVFQSTVGLAWGDRVRGVLSKGNRFESVDQPYAGDMARIKIAP